MICCRLQWLSRIKCSIWPSLTRLTDDTNNIKRFRAVRDPLICQRGSAIPSPQTTTLYQSPLKTAEKAKESSSSMQVGLVCHILLLWYAHARRRCFGKSRSTSPEHLKIYQIPEKGGQKRSASVKQLLRKKFARTHEAIRKLHEGLSFFVLQNASRSF